MKVMIAVLGTMVVAASAYQGDWANVAIAGVTTAALLWRTPGWRRERQDG